MADFVRNSSVFYQDVTASLNGTQPVFLSRIGGSDTAALVDYLRVKDLGPNALQEHLSKHLPIVSRYNGFYDLARPRETYFDYLNCLLGIYHKTAAATLCNFQLLSIYFRDSLHESFVVEEFENKSSYIRLIESVASAMPAAKFYPYQLIERMVLGRDSLFRVFSVALKAKRVLVVSPFAESIQANFGRRHEFFRDDYDYPDFDLELVNSPITYAGLPTSMYPHDNWFSTLAALKSEIAAKTFDIALLCCGSYALPLGEHIKETLGKKAVYVGGVLQLYFGIMGRRYVNPFFTDQISVDKFILPLERDRYLKHVQISPELAHEAFGAYF